MRTLLTVGLAALLLGSSVWAAPEMPGRRRSASTVNVDARQRLVVYGDRVCPDGFTPLIVGNVYAFQQQGVDVPGFGGVDPACWKNPPLETTFLGQWTSVGDCVVCEPASPGSPTSTGTSSAPGARGGGRVPIGSGAP